MRLFFLFLFFPFFILLFLFPFFILLFLFLVLLFLFLFFLIFRKFSDIKKIQFNLYQRTAAGFFCWNSSVSQSSSVFQFLSLALFRPERNDGLDDRLLTDSVSVADDLVGETVSSGNSVEN